MNIWEEQCIKFGSEDKKSLKSVCCLVVSSSFQNKSGQQTIAERVNTKKNLFLLKEVELTTEVKFSLRKCEQITILK